MAVYSVTQVNAYIKTLFSRNAASSRITIRGEVSNRRCPETGTIYFTLKDEGAAISCVMFQTDRQTLQFRLENGQKIDATGQISVYEKTGVYQLYVRTAEPVGNGELYERFLKLKARMEEMGMFDPGYKKPIPAHAMSIGIITAEGGAAIRDIINVSKRRNPYVRLYLMPTLVQGQYAAEDIAAAIKKMDRLHPDVMIVGRGGGSIEDLWAFNEEVVAQAIFDCETPVISAVGHETDFTIADFVSDLRAPTPSAAAELANFDYYGFEEQVSGYRDRLHKNITYRSELLKQKLCTLRTGIQNAGPVGRLQRMRERLEKYRLRIEADMERTGADAKNRYEFLSSRLPDMMERKLERTTARMRLLAGRLDGCSPLKKLSGGFGYLMSGGKGVLHAGDLKPGDELTSFVSDGKIVSCVEQVYPDDAHMGRA